MENIKNDNNENIYKKLDNNPSKLEGITIAQKLEDLTNRNMELFKELNSLEGKHDDKSKEREIEIKEEMGKNTARISEEKMKADVKGGVHSIL